MVTTFPPTPDASVELVPRVAYLPQDQSLDLGPAALASTFEGEKKSSFITEISAQDLYLSSPTSPILQTVALKSSTPQVRSTRSKRVAVLKPPPPRRNPIIQMQPKCNSQVAKQTDTTTTKSRKKSEATKNKKNDASTTDERQKARKSTHSEIERRRRLKINHQFELLKSLVPACHNQDMHKLTILEATTEYIQYLLDAMKDVKSNFDSTSDITNTHVLHPIPSQSPLHETCKDPFPRLPFNLDNEGDEVHEENEEEEEEDEAEEEEEGDNVLMGSMPMMGISMSTLPSPYLLASKDFGDLGLISSSSSDHDASEALLLLSDQTKAFFGGHMEVNSKPLTVREMLS